MWTGSPMPSAHPLRVPSWSDTRRRGPRRGSSVCSLPEDLCSSNCQLVALFPVADCHVWKGDGIVVSCVACLSESLHASLYDPLHRGPGWLQVVAGIELRGVLGEGLADRTRRRQTQVSVDVYLPHALLDALLYLSHGHAPRGLYVAAVLVHNVDNLFGSAGGTVHNEVCGRKPRVDLLDDVHGEDLAVRLLDELVSLVARPDGDRQSVNPRPLDELHGLVRVRQVHLTRANVVLYAAERT